jgi:hypothetical protein
MDCNYYSIDGRNQKRIIINEFARRDEEMNTWHDMQRFPLIQSSITKVIEMTLNKKKNRSNQQNPVSSMRENTFPSAQYQRAEPIFIMSCSSIGSTFTKQIAHHNIGVIP